MKKYTPIILICLFVITAYFNTLSSEFVFDDIKTIERNESIRDLSNVKRIWQSNPTRFVSYFSFAINYKISKLDVTSYHVFNIFIHTLTGLGIFIFLKLLTRTPYLKKDIGIYQKLPFLGSLLFIVHPVQTQAVTYTTQRIASMAALFYILSLVFFLKLNLQADKSKKFKVGLFAALTIIFALLAFFTKENTFTLPLAIILVHFSFFTSYKKDILKKSVVFVPIVVVASFIALTSHAYWTYFSKLEFLKLLSSFNFLDVARIVTNKFDASYFFTQFKVIIYYIFLFLFPVKQNLDYDFPASKSFFEPATFISFILIVVLLSTSFAIRKKNPLISFGIFFFFLALSIESSILTLTDVIYEHRLYLPSLGLVVVAAAAFCQLQNFISKKLQVGSDRKVSYKRISRFALFSIVFLLSLATISRNRTWNTQISIWSDTVAKSPNKARPYNNLGLALTEKEQYVLGATAFEKSAQLSGQSQEYVNLGITLVKLGKTEEAIKQYKKAIEIDPTNFDAYNSIGNLFLTINELDLASNYFEKSINLNQDNPEGLIGLSKVFYKKGDLKTANELLSKARKQINALNTLEQ